MTFQDGSTAECIDMRNCSNNTFTNLTISGCEGAIYLYESSRNVYSNITVYGNSLGFYIQKSTNNTFRDIVSKFNSNYGLYVESSVNNTFLSVTSLSNHVGFGFIHSDSNKIERSIIDSNGIGIKLTDSGVRWPNRIYNNLIKNNTYNLDSDLTTNIWNTTISAGQRIYSNGTEIGGNYWGRSNSSTFGFSETCNDSDNNGFCDSLYVLDSSNIDYLPLSNKYIWTSITTSTTITTTTTATTTTTPFLGVVLNQPSSGSNASSNVSLNFTVVGSNLTYNASLNLNGSVNNQTVDNIQNNTLSSWDLTSLSPGVYWWNVTAWINSSVHNVSETWNFTVTTTTTVTTMTATTSTTMTIPAECELAGNYAPCDTVSLSEVINLINLWVNNTVTLSDVITLITVWANGSGI
jgi:parallel beta-helix repeat protein